MNRIEKFEQLRCLARCHRAVPPVSTQTGHSADVILPFVRLHQSSSALTTRDLSRYRFRAQTINSGNHCLRKPIGSEPRESSTQVHLGPDVTNWNGGFIMKLGASIIFQNYFREEKPDWQLYEEDLALADMVEPLGFDSIWGVEHHFSPYTMLPDV